MHHERPGFYYSNAKYITNTFMGSLVPIHSVMDWTASTFYIACVLDVLATIPNAQQGAMDGADVGRVLKSISRRCGMWPCSPIRIDGDLLADCIRSVHPESLETSITQTLDNMCFDSGLVPLKGIASIRYNVI